LACGSWCSRRSPSGSCFIWAQPEWINSAGDFWIGPWC
jgi:hypothetical protein